MRVNKIFQFGGRTMALLRVLMRKNLKNSLFAAAFLSVLAAPASAFELKPFKNKLFAYPKTLQSSDNGNYRIVDYQELRDINGRDDVPEKRVNKRYIDYAGRRATKPKSIQTENGAAKYYYAGKANSPSIVTIYVHGSGGNGKQGINDFSFGGNFNRLKMLMLKNGGLYLSPDAEAFGPVIERRIVSILKSHIKSGTARHIVLACGSAGGDICHRLSNNSDMVPFLAGIAFLGSYWSDDYVSSQAVRAGVPTFIGHGSNDAVFPIAKMENFYTQLRQTGSPVRMVRFESGTHGTPIRMVNWRETINWMLSY